MSQPLQSYLYKCPYHYKVTYSSIDHHQLPDNCLPHNWHTKVGECVPNICRSALTNNWHSLPPCQAKVGICGHINYKSHLDVNGYGGTSWNQNDFMLLKWARNRPILTSYLSKAICVRQIGRHKCPFCLSDQSKNTTRVVQSRTNSLLNGRSTNSADLGHQFARTFIPSEAPSSIHILLLHWT